MSLPVTPSQTVGPFFGIGLPYEGGEQVVPPDSPGTIRVEGQVFDGHGDPVPDALLEAWEPTVGFGRSRTDHEGVFHFLLRKPSSSSGAPYINITVFARGLLRHLVTRLYFPDEPANAADPVLQQLEPERRQTLIGRSRGNVLHFDIRLQGDGETVFFTI